MVRSWKEGKGTTRGMVSYPRVEDSRSTSPPSQAVQVIDQNLSSPTSTTDRREEASTAGHLLALTSLQAHGTRIEPIRSDHDCQLQMPGLHTAVEQERWRG